MFYADLCFPETIAMIEEQFCESVSACAALCFPKDRKVLLIAHEWFAMSSANLTLLHEHLHLFLVTLFAIIMLSRSLQIWRISNSQEQ
jgi:hypothetical protein